MSDAIARTLAQIGDPAFRALIWRSIGLTILAFVGLWLVAGWLVGRLDLFAIAWLDTLVEWLGGALGVLLTLLLFPPMATLAAALFQDSAAALVEARHYPDLPPTRGTAIGPAIGAAIRLLWLTVLINLIALPLYIILPGISLAFYFAINGLLLGREYYDVVSLRRLDKAAATSLRRRNRTAVWLAGTLIALGFWVPLVNFAMPLLGTALMVHVFERARRRGDSARARSDQVGTT